MTRDAPQRLAPHVLHVRCVTGRGGGPEKTILNSPRFLEPLGYRSTCAYLHPPMDKGFGGLRLRAEAAKAPLVSVPDRGPFDFRPVRQLIRLCRDEKVAIWHGHDYKSNALGLVVRRFWPMKLVTTVHGWVRHTRRTPLYYRVDKLCLPQYEGVICVSEDLYQQCLRLGVQEPRCQLVPNGITSEAFQRTKSQDEARGCFAHPLPKLLVGAMGRLSPEKGFDLLIRAASELLDAGTDLSLWIAGDGAQRGELESLIAECGHQDRIRLLGHVDSSQTFYEALDVFVLSSLREGLPNVLLEAMALGLPVLATRVAGTPALVQHDANGLLIAPGSSAKLAQGLHELLSDPNRAKSLGSAAQRRVRESFSFEQRMQTMATFYNHLMTPDRPAIAPAQVRA